VTAAVRALDPLAVPRRPASGRPVRRHDGAERGFRVSLGRLLPEARVPGQVPPGPRESGLLALPGLQPVGRLDREPTGFVPPAIGGLLGAAQGTADLSDGLRLRSLHLGFTEWPISRSGACRGRPIYPSLPCPIPVPPSQRSRTGSRGAGHTTQAPDRRPTCDGEGGTVVTIYRQEKQCKRRYTHSNNGVERGEHRFFHSNREIHQRCSTREQNGGGCQYTP
jgi:hypothetical protein